MQQFQESFKPPPSRLYRYRTNYWSQLPTNGVSHQPMELATRWHLMPHPPLIHTISWLPNQPCASSSLGITMTTPPEGQRVRFQRIRKGLGEKRCQVLQPNTKIGWEWNVTLLKAPKKRRGEWKVSTTLSFSDLVTVWVLVLLFPCHGCLVRCFFSFLWLHSSKLRMAARVDNVDRLMANCWVLAGGHGVFLNRLLFSENIFVKCFNGSWESYFEFQE